MNKTILISGIIALFILTALTPMSIGYNVKVSIKSNDGNTLYVGGSGPGNYTNIQQAINDANPGDTVFVYNGTYRYYVMVDKSINLIGEDKNNTIIEGGWETLVNVVADRVFITGFTVRDCGYYYQGGINIGYNSDNNTIIGNILIDNLVCGISISGDYNTIANNIIKNNEYNGIDLDEGTDNLIIGNIIDSNPQFGIYFNCFSDTNENISIKDNMIINSQNGIYISDGNNTKIFYNIITSNSCGIQIRTWCPWSYINHTLIENNTILNNEYGIIFHESNQTIVTNNIIVSNNRGIYIFDSNNNLVYNNNFINNSNRPLDETYSCEDCINQWYSSYPTGGNYWSDYNESDNYSGPNQDISGEDGIGDVPYNISGNANSQDRYPLMEPWNNSPPNSPFINGPTNGKVGIDYNYTFISTDPDEDDIWYYISWGDKEIIYIYGPYPSGETITLSYNWSNKGNYIIQCKAMDENYLESNWTELEVTMPREKALVNSLILWFLEQFPLLNLLLQRLRI